jgi:LysM domain
VANTLGTFHLEELNPPKGRGRYDFKGIMNGAPVVVAGYGGWEKIARPKRKALTEWKGREGVSIEITFMLDAALYEMTGREVEQSCRELESLAGVGVDEPPLCQLRSDPAALMPHGEHRAPHVKWFVESLTWDKDATRYNNAGNRDRAAGTLVVSQHVKDDLLSAVKRRKANKAKKGSKRKSYEVKSGDTLSEIAARKDVYGDAKKWRKIAEANNIRDPNRLRVGQKLRIP